MIGVFNIPFMVAGLVIGFSLILIGLLFYFLAPLEKALKGLQEERKKAQLREAVEDLKTPSPMNRPLPATPVLAPPVIKSEEAVKLEDSLSLVAPVSPVVQKSTVLKKQVESLNDESDFAEQTKTHIPVMDNPISFVATAAVEEKPQTLSAVVDSMISSLTHECQNKGISLTVEMTATHMFKFDFNQNDNSFDPKCYGIYGSCRQ